MLTTKTQHNTTRSISVGNSGKSQIILEFSFIREKREKQVFFESVEGGDLIWFE